jgi:hypothetical protein
MFSILGPVRTREALEPVKKMANWGVFQSLASEFISPNIKNHYSNEADKAARDFISSIASSYWPLTTKTMILECKCEISGLGRL